ncbi:hypothetical protein DH2020_020149 [Rehmannia glutinosa]|uniref:BHLH domain-containing protein n=1 Tax=Rehmannia glutinosa TaxID=99300 RepID=A0ABR0WK32_REHGL
MDQNDPFQSALSSMVSSPTASNANGNNNGENIVLRELIGRLGSICNSGEISPHQPYSSNINNGNNNNNYYNNSANTSCYSTPLNSPPKLNLSTLTENQQIRAGNHFPSLAPFSSDPGFAERAARFSCFADKSLVGLNELDSGKISRVSSSNQSLKISGSNQQNKEADKKLFSRLSRSSTPENAEVGDSRENSSVSQNDASNSRKRKSIPKGKGKGKEASPAAKDANVTSENSAKRSKSEDEKDDAKAKASFDTNQKQSKDNSKPAEAPKDYIHVRARRGQATDAHSLAERVRREKISERMKVLQDLVPGCNKVTGKAVMLDEIINYVQSLQRQVEFLSMKLATVNPRMDINMEALMSKDVMFESRGSLPHNIYPSDSYPNFQSQPNAIPTGTDPPFTPNNFSAAFGRNQNVQLSTIDSFNETASQVKILATAQMKVEL